MHSIGCTDVAITLCLRGSRRAFMRAKPPSPGRWAHASCRRGWPSGSLEINGPMIDSGRMSRNIYLDLLRGVDEIVERSQKISKHAVSVRSNCREGLLARQPLAHVRVAAQYGCIRWQVRHRRQQAHIGAMAFSILDK